MLLSPTIELFHQMPWTLRERLPDLLHRVAIQEKIKKIAKLRQSYDSFCTQKLQRTTFVCIINIENFCMTIAIVHNNSNITFRCKQQNIISIKLIWDRQTNIALIELLLQLKAIIDLPFHASVMNQKHVMIQFKLESLVIIYYGSFF